MANTNTSTVLLRNSIIELRSDVARVARTIAEMENSLPEPGTIEFERLSAQEEIIGTRVMIRLDSEYLQQLKGDLRRLERMAA